MPGEADTTMSRFKFDGSRFEIKDQDDSEQTPDIYRGQQGIQPVIQPTELGETIKEINNDSEDATRMSQIDMKTRLTEVERNACMLIDWSVAAKRTPRSLLLLTRQMKRLNVSLSGKGRGEIVELVVGKREHDEKKGNMGIGDRIKSFMGIGGGKE